MKALVITASEKESHLVQSTDLLFSQLNCQVTYSKELNNNLIEDHQIILLEQSIFGKESIERLINIKEQYEEKSLFIIVTTKINRTNRNKLLSQKIQTINTPLMLVPALKKIKGSLR